MQSGKVVLACVLGAFIGALTGLHFGHLWISVLVGGLVGYLSFEASTVASMAPRAWSQATNWHPDFSWAPKLLKMWALGLGASFNYILLFVLFHWLFPSTHKGRLDYFLLGQGVVWLFLGAFWGPLVFGLKSDGFFQKIHAHIPLLFWIWYAPKGAISGAIWIGRRVPAMVRTLSRFARCWFDFVHSDLRLLCMIDAAIGATVGYCFHNPVIGAIVGGLSGLLNYEILSVRVLKLIPTEQSILARFR